MSEHKEYAKGIFYRCPEHGRFHGYTCEPGKVPPDWMLCTKCQAVSYVYKREARACISVNGNRYDQFKAGADKLGLTLRQLVEKAVKGFL